MEKLLDKEVHQMYKAPASSVYYSSATNSQQNNGSSYLSVDEKASNEESAPKEVEDNEIREESDNVNSSNDVAKDTDRQSSATRPRSLPSAQSSSSNSSRMRDLRQSHRFVILFCIYFLIFSFSVWSKKKIKNKIINVTGAKVFIMFFFNFIKT